MASKAFSLVFVFFSLSATLTASAGNVCLEGGQCINDPSITSDPSAAHPAASTSKSNDAHASQLTIISGPNGGSLLVDVPAGGLTTNEAPTLPANTQSTVNIETGPYVATNSSIPQHCYQSGSENDCVILELCGRGDSRCSSAQARLEDLKKKAQEEADKAKQQQQQQQPQQQQPPGGGSPQGGQGGDKDKDKNKDNKDQGGSPQNGGAPQCGNGGAGEDNGKDENGEDRASQKEGCESVEALAAEYKKECKEKEVASQKICGNTPKGGKKTANGGATAAAADSATENANQGKAIIAWANKCMPAASSCSDRCEKIQQKLENDCKGKPGASELKDKVDASKQKCDADKQKAQQGCQQGAAQAGANQDGAQNAGQSGAGGNPMDALKDLMKPKQDQKQPQTQTPQVPSNALCTDFANTRSCRCRNLVPGDIPATIVRCNDLMGGN